MIRGIARLISMVFVSAIAVAAQSVTGVPPGLIAELIKPTPGQPDRPRKDIPAIAKDAEGAVVTIVMTNDDKSIALGTGFLVRRDGVIVTNYHVIAKGNAAMVKFADGTISPVDGVLVADKIRDLAIIKIHGRTFRILSLGNSDQVNIGQDVVAIGNPLGLELSVSNGIVSGVRKDEREGGKLLQITAPISHGSSGGPLLNLFGEVIGISAMFLEGGEHLNFAIPINDAKRMLANIPAATKPGQFDFGFGVQELPNESAPPSETDSSHSSAPDDGTSAPVEAATPKATLDQKMTCSKLAEHSYDRHTLAYRNATDVTYTSSFTSHLDAASSTCFAIITETMKGRVSSSGEEWTLVTFGISVYDALEDTLYAQLNQNWRGTDWVDQETLPSNGFVLALSRDYLHAVMKRPEDGETGLTWFRLAIQNLLGIKL